MDEKYNVLDLGCRTGSSVASWKAAGDKIIGVDWEEFGQEIIGDFTKEETWKIIDNRIGLDQPYDFIWFSPDCSIFSMANMRWKPNISRDFEPVSERAIREIEGIKFVIQKIKERSPRLGWVMENPRALMRKMDFVQDLDRVTVSYCQYGDSRMKPTDLFGEIPWLFEPKLCKNGDKCHTPAPRGSSTGTQGMTKTKAGKIPFELSFRIREAAILSHRNWQYTLGDFV
jgi:hypothetical protein